VKTVSGKVVSHSLA